MAKLLTILLAFYSSISFSQEKNIKSIPFNEIQGINLNKLLGKDTIIKGVKEYTLIDTITGQILIDNYGFTSSIKIIDSTIIITQFACLNNKQIGFTEYEIKILKDKYCITRNDNYFNKNQIQDINKIKNLDIDSKHFESFLGCLGDNPINYFKLLSEGDSFMSPTYFRQLYMLGIINHYMKHKSPVLLRERKELNKCFVVEK